MSTRRRILPWRSSATPASTGSFARNGVARKTTSAARGDSRRFDFGVGIPRHRLRDAVGTGIAGRPRDLMSEALQVIRQRAAKATVSEKRDSHDGAPHSARVVSKQSTNITSARSRRQCRRGPVSHPSLPCALAFVHETKLLYNVTTVTWLWHSDLGSIVVGGLQLAHADDEALLAQGSALGRTTSSREGPAIRDSQARRVITASPHAIVFRCHDVLWTSRQAQLGDRS